MESPFLQNKIGFRDNQEKLAALCAAIHTGRQSSVSDLSMGDVLREVRAEIAEIIDEV